MIGSESDKIETLDVARRIWAAIVNEIILLYIHIFFLHIGAEQ